MSLYIKVGSITLAQRGASILRKKGYKPLIKRIMRPSETKGCGYTIVVDAEDEEPVRILEENNIRVKGTETR